jgi:hypothetical protein
VPLLSRHPSGTLPQAIADTFALREKGRIIAHRNAAPTSDGKGRIERQSGLHGGSRLVQFVKMSDVWR